MSRADFGPPSSPFPSGVNLTVEHLLACHTPYEARAILGRELVIMRSAAANCTDTELHRHLDGLLERIEERQIANTSLVLLMQAIEDFRAEHLKPPPERSSQV